MMVARPDVINSLSRSEGGTKFDRDKLRFDLLPVRPLEEVVRVLTYGAAKYGDRNWEHGLRWGRVFSAAMRHLWAWWRGEENDPETGISHLAHAACDILFLLEYTRTHPELDDRAKPTHQFADTLDSKSGVW